MFGLIIGRGTLISNVVVVLFLGLAENLPVGTESRNGCWDRFLLLATWDVLKRRFFNNKLFRGANLDRDPTEAASSPSPPIEGRLDFGGFSLQYSPNASWLVLDSRRDCGMVLVLIYECLCWFLGLLLCHSM